MAEVLRFDFGPEGEAKDGYVKVTDRCVYDADKGFGFVSTESVTAREREWSAELERDFCIPYHSKFVVDVPNGSYQVKLTAGDAQLPMSMTLKSGMGHIVFTNLATIPGQFIQYTFSTNVRDGQLRLAFSGVAPRLNALEIVPVPRALKVFIAGDSTAADQPEDGYPYAGWGQMLGMYFKHDVVVANHAYSGRSSKSFIDEGRLGAIMSEIQSDDFLFIQFGHNDQKKDPERSTDPQEGYPQYLMKYIEAARSKGAHPVLLTSVQRRFFNSDGTLQDTHGEYLTAMRRLAEKEQVPLIDMALKTKALYESLGEERSKSLFMWGEPGEFANFSAGVQDNTHYQEYGAVQIAGLVAEGIKELNLWPLPLYLR